MRRLAALLATVAVTAAAGCGIRGDAGAVDVVASAAFLASSAERTADASTGRFEVVAEISGLPGTEAPLRVTGEGAYDGEAGRATVTVDLSGTAAALEGVGGEGAEEAAAALAEPMVMVIDGRDAYLQFPLLLEQAGVDATWVRIGPDSLGTGAAALPVSPGSFDPRSLLDFLHGVEGSVEEVGTGEVRGVDTTHLRATVSPDDLLAAVPEADRARVEQVFQGLAEQIGTFPLDVWVDDQGRVRRVQAAYDIPGSATGQAADLGSSVTVEYFGFGDDVTIEVPTEGVVDIGELIGGASGD